MKKEKRKYFGIDVDKINSIIKTGTWDRRSNGKPVIVAGLTLIEGDPEEHYKTFYPDLVSEVVGGLKDAIVQIDQPAKEV